MAAEDENNMSSSSGVRLRRYAPSKNLSSNTEKEDREQGKAVRLQICPELSTDTYWLTRILLLRSISFIYGVAFLVAFWQNKQLLGRNGLLPAHLYLSQVKEHSGGLNLQAVVHVPTLLWFSSPKTVDIFLEWIAIAGLLISIAVFITGAANVIAMLLLWVLYHSLVNVGQRWYSFGWESQLLETGFLSIFLCPLWKWNTLPHDSPPSTIVVWCYRWLLFRIMLGAGLIKVRGDRCWRDLTCMNYHYETQPVPNFFSYYMHHLPEHYHKFEVLSNHFVELIVPWFAFLTRRFRICCGIFQILFQVALILSGNLSFLNWLTIVPSIAFFDDCSLGILFSNKTGSLKWQVWKLQQRDRDTRKYKVGKVRRVVNLSLGLCIAFLSIPVVINLMSPSQHMNTSFEPLRIVNTYGAFGSVTKKRNEVIFKGTDHHNPYSSDAIWKEYEFHCKPGNISRRPCWISPYHYRLDWLMWFAAFQNYQYNPWLVNLAAKLLTNDENAVSLIEYNPFPDKPPRFVKADLYRYSYSKIGSESAKKGQWWDRRYVESYLQPVSVEILRPTLKKFEWIS